MREINLEELKQIQLEMLAKIDEFCKNNKIKYFLTAGSLIGAIRHHGFIPWDDDIDIMMLREDYENFIYTFNGKVENLYVEAPELNWNFYAPFANVFDKRTLLIEKNRTYCDSDICVKIDIFPFDTLPNSNVIYCITRFIVLALNLIMRVKRLDVPLSDMPPKYRLVKLMFGWFPHRWAQILIHKIAISNRDDVNADVFLRTFDIKKPMRANKKIFEKAIYTPFEQYFFPIPVLADEYLRIRFGDYMKLPPKEERIPHHNFTAYWK